MKTYEPENVSIEIGGQEIKGFVTNEPIVIERRRSLWHEIKAAFPFFWSAEVQKVKDSKKKLYRWETTNDSRVNYLKLPYLRGRFDGGRIQYNCRCAVVPLEKDAVCGPKDYELLRTQGCIKPIGRDNPKPIKLWPWYAALGLYVAALMIDGLVRHLKYIW